MKKSSPFNGIMIDAARLIEKPAFYYRLIDFMAEWKMNTLLFHFTDDHGCAVKLPGFEHLASKNALSGQQLGNWLKYAARKGIDVIPELETFGHTRFITDHPKYKHLFAGKNQKKLVFNAIDPLHRETHHLVKKLIRATTSLFKSPYLHIGCDEVDMKQYCQMKGGIDEQITWTYYVNSVIQYTREAGKIPVFWADHPVHDPIIAELLRKDIIAIDWRYRDDVKDDVLPKLIKAGFEHVVSSPSIAWWQYRYLPSHSALENTRRMAQFNSRHGGLGVLNTIWCPFRYIQNTIWYGIAFSSYAYQTNGKGNLKKFHELFARKVFSTALNPTIETILNHLSDIQIDDDFFFEIAKPDLKFNRNPKRLNSKVNRVYKGSKKILSLASQYKPAKNKDIYDALILAAKCTHVISLALMGRKKITPEEAKSYPRLRGEAEKLLINSWDLGRFENDPQKLKPRFPGEDHQYAILLMKKLPRSL